MESHKNTKTHYLLILSHLIFSISSSHQNPHFARTLVHTFQNCDLVLVTNDSPTPQVAEDIIATSAVQQSPITLRQNLKGHNRDTHNSKHHELHIVYLSFPPEGAPHVELYLPIIYHDPEDGSFSRQQVHVLRDTIVHVMDLARTWDLHRPFYQLDKYLPSTYIFPTVLIAQYDDGGMAIVHFRIRCSKFYICLEDFWHGFWESAPSLTFEYITSEVKSKREKFYGSPVFALTEWSTDETWETVKAQLQKPWRHFRPKWRSSVCDLMTYYHMANRLNFSLTTVYEGTMDRRSHLFLQYGLMRGIRGLSESHLSPVLPAEYVIYHSESFDVIIYSSAVFSSSPISLESLTSPFSIEVWVILVLLFSLVFLIAYAKNKSLNVGTFILSMLSPLNGQASDCIGGKRYAWYAIWVLILSFLTNFYLGVLDSTTIVPIIRKSNKTFDELISENFTFYADLRLYVTYKLSSGDQRRLVARQKEGFLTTKEVSEYLILSQRLMSFTNRSENEQIFKLPRTAWLETNTGFKIFQRFVQETFQKNLNILPQRFLEWWQWIVFIVPHGEVVVQNYKRLEAAGVQIHWRELAQREYQRMYLNNLIKMSTKDERTKWTTEPVGIHAALILEALCIAGIGFAAGVLAFVYETSIVILIMRFLRRKFTQALDFWMDYRREREAKPIV